MNIPTPFLVFLGDAQDYKQAKVAAGVVEWRPELCVGQYQLIECGVDFKLPTMTPKAAAAAGAKTFLIGISPYTTSLPESYRSIIIEAMECGLNIASPLHDKLDEELELMASVHGVEIFNFRHRSVDYPKGNGEPRTGLRLLTVGTDCACGKKFTALTLDRSYKAAGGKSTFRATGQTGFLISQSGINNDTIQADFLSGAAEWLTPENDADHWDIVEGQGALSHPSFGAGSLSLIYGTQPDYVVLCTEPGRMNQRGVKRSPLSILEEVDLVLRMGRRTNPNIRLAGVSLFTRDATLQDIENAILTVRSQYATLPIFDPAVAHSKGVDRTTLLRSAAGLTQLIDTMQLRAMSSYCTDGVSCE